MLKKIMGGLLAWLADRLDHTVKQEDVRTFIQNQYRRLHVKKTLPLEIEQDLALTAAILVELGWLNGPAGQLEHVKEMSCPYGLDVEWFGKRGLMPNAGKALDWLDTHASEQDQQVVHQVMEKLLRHVEVRRERSLRKFTDAVTLPQAWLERCDISILFSRFARRHNDLRFLNTALKMNEWYLKVYNSSANDTMTARFVLALAEQELSVRELLPC